MIYLSKLAKRLALAGPRSGLLLSLLAFVGSCASPEEREFLSPNPTQPIPITSLTLDPKIGSVRPGEVIEFTATARNAKGAVVLADVDWSATGGTISASGTFVSEVYGQFQVRASLRANAAISDSALVGVFVNPNDVLKLSVSPNGEEVGEGEGIQLEATAELADGRVVVQPALAWSAAVGEVDGTGYFVAPEAEGLYEVRALAPSGVSASASIVVTPTKKVLHTVTISPGSVSLIPGQAQQFTAIGIWESGSGKAIPTVWSSTGGTITANGLFTAASTPGNFKIIGRYQWGTQADTAFVSITEPQIVGLDVAPGGASLAVGATQQYAANARMSDGTTKPVGATWEATGGTISPSGLYSATANGAWKVSAKIAGTTLSGEADVTVTTPTATLVSLVLNPSTVTVPAGGHSQFTVTGSWSDGVTRTPQVTWVATGGTITSGGDYTAGSAPGTFRVIASADGKADTSAVTVAGPQLNSLNIAPDGAALTPGATQQFTVSGGWSDGGSATPVVTWSAEGGSITGGGLYTPGGAAGTYRVFATHSSGRADTALVTVSPQAPVLVSISLAPGSVNLAPGGTRQFSVSAAWTNGGTGTPPVTYTATGGTVTADGLYTAGSAAGTFRVIARQTDGTIADTSSVVISSAAPTLVSLAVSPKTTSLQTGGSRQFAVNGTWSDGSTGAPGVSWTATGGTVSSAGLYVAPASVGTFKVVARDAAGTKADTATVTVTAPAALVALDVTPGTKTLVTGEEQQFTAQATYSNGGTGTPSLAWTATGGSINSSGLYTAAASAGSYRVIAQVAGTTVKDTAVVTLSPVVQGPALVAQNRPAGHTTLFDVNFATKAIGWSLSPRWNDTTYLRAVSDAGAPASGPGAVEFVFPVGFADVTSPARASKAFSARREVYVAYWIKISNPWQYHTSSVNKLFLIGTSAGTAGNEVVVSLKGTSATNAQIRLGVQNPANNGAGTQNGYYLDNMGHPGFALGTWHLIEVHGIGNTGGQPNGRLRWWVDGILVGDHSNVLYDPAGDGYFDTFILDPNWGGQGSPPKAQRDWIRVDHFLATVK